MKITGEIRDIAILVNGSRVNYVNIGDEVVIVISIIVNNSGNYRVCFQVDDRGRPCADFSASAGEIKRFAWKWIENGPEGEYTVKVWLYSGGKGISGLVPIDVKEVPYYVRAQTSNGYEWDEGGGGDEEWPAEEERGPSISGIVTAVAGIGAVITAIIYLVKRRKR